MQNKLYMISLGPGDMELLTLKALNAFRECEAICVPTKSADGSFSKSITYRIVQEVIAYLQITPKIVPVYMPMRYKKEDWVRETKTILESVEAYGSVGFVTLGDAAIYSSIYYILEIIKQKNRALFESCEVIAGVTSFSAASAVVKKPLCLGDERLTIEPINPKENPKTTKILMRPAIGMETDILGEGDFYTFENLFLEDEKITPKRIKRVKKYMTLFINFAKRAFS